MLMHRSADLESVYHNAKICVSRVEMRNARGEDSKMKKDICFSVLQINKKDKSELQSLGDSLNMSLTQIVVFGAITAIKMEHEKREKPDDRIQIRLPRKVHEQLEVISKSKNIPMTELIAKGIDEAFRK